MEKSVKLLCKNTISRKVSRRVKETFLENYGENNVSMKLSNVKDTKNIEDFLVENIREIHYEAKNEKSPRHSKAGQM